MSKMGFPEDAITMISNMYEGSSIRVQTTHGLTPPIPLLVGLHQGCNLSPLLFCLTLEPLLWLLQDSPTSYQFFSCPERIGAAGFVDDLCIPANGIDSASRDQLSIVEQWEAWSNNKFNVCPQWHTEANGVRRTWENL
jgi:hypothetical protein